MKVRDTLPVRRSNTTKNPTKNWTLHKKDLQEDFNHYCAYCGSYAGYRHTYFEVDHFIPKDFLLKSGSNIGICHYGNLVFSCKFCNNNKLSKWPTQREDIFNLNNEGFIDPCNSEYDDHIYRTSDGGIMWHTALGKWMAIEAFKFDERDNSIKLLWELNQRRILILAFAKELSKRNEGTMEYDEIKKKAGGIGYEYALLHNELMDYYNNL